LTLAVSFSAPVLADSGDPTVHQIYEAAAAGHLDQAQQNDDQVLRDHPKRLRLHYVSSMPGKTTRDRNLGQPDSAPRWLPPATT